MRATRNVVVVVGLLFCADGALSHRNGCRARTEKLNALTLVARVVAKSQRQLLQLHVQRGPVVQRLVGHLELHIHEQDFAVGLLGLGEQHHFGQVDAALDGQSGLCLAAAAAAAAAVGVSALLGHNHRRRSMVVVVVIETGAFSLVNHLLLLLFAAVCGDVLWRVAAADGLHGHLVQLEDVRQAQVDLEVVDEEEDGRLVAHVHRVADLDEVAVSQHGQKHPFDF